MIGILEQNKQTKEPLPNVISRYIFEFNTLDSVGQNNGFATDIVYVGGGVSVSADFNGSTSNVVIPDNDDLSFSSLPFSVTVLVYFNSLGNMILVNKMGATTNREYLIQYVNDRYRFRLFGAGGTTIYKNIDYITTPTLNTYYHLTCTDDGSNDTSGIKIYLDAVNVGTATKVGSYTGMTEGNNDIYFGQYSGGSDVLFFDGRLDEVIFWDKVLNQSEITEISTKQLAGTDINP